MFRAAFVERTGAGQRLLPAIFPADVPRPEGSAYDVRDRPEDGTYDSGRERVGGPAGESWLCRSFECARGPTQSDGMHYHQRLGIGSADPRGNDGQPIEGDAAPHRRGAESVAAHLHENLQLLPVEMIAMLAVAVV